MLVAEDRQGLAISIEEPGLPGRAEQEAITVYLLLFADVFGVEDLINSRLLLHIICA